MAAMLAGGYLIKENAMNTNECEAAAKE